MPRPGWPALMLVPLLVAIVLLARTLRKQSGAVGLAARARFLVVSLLVHAGLLFALDLVLVTVPVVEANKELIETVFAKTFALFPAGRGTSGPSWEKLPEGPPPADPTVEPADAHAAHGRDLPFDPALAGIAPTIPDALARSLPPERVLYLPRPTPEAMAPAPSELPRVALVVPEVHPPDPPRLEPVEPAPEPAPEARTAPIDRRAADPRPAAPLPAAVPAIEPRFLAPARPAPAKFPEDAGPPPLVIAARPPPPIPEAAPPDLASPPLPASAEPLAAPAEAPTLLPRAAPKDVEPARRPAPLPRVDRPLPAPTLPRVEFAPKLDALPTPLPAIRLPEPGPALALASVPPDLSASFALRPPEVRKELVKAMGGTDASEAAVERGLAWLVAHQGPEGNWSLDDLHCRGHRCDSPGSSRVDPAATGLALMALLGAGNSPEQGTHSAAVKRGVAWLVAHQRPDGGLCEPGGSQMYGHALAAIPLCEALGMGADPALREPAARAIRFIVEAQDPATGGWRYNPRGGGDTSVFGWQLMALKSAEMAGLPVPAETYRLANRWLDSVVTGPHRQLYAYQPHGEVRVSMTAEALLCRQYLGAARSDASMVEGGHFLRANPPKWDARHSYSWYYATQVLYHLRGDDWAAWNGTLREMLVSAQVKDGPAAGSWHPHQPSSDKWGDAGGRVYETAISLLMLEVYYRHLPLYQQLSGDGSAPPG